MKNCVTADSANHKSKYLPRVVSWSRIHKNQRFERLRKTDGSDIPIEEGPADEATGYRDNQWAAEGVKVRNPAFDVTPAELVTELTTESSFEYV